MLAGPPTTVLYLTDQTRMGGDTRAEFLTLRELDPASFTVTSFCPPVGATHEAFSTEAALAARSISFGSDLGGGAVARIRSLLQWLRATATVSTWALRNRPDVVFVGDRPRAIAVALVAAVAGRSALVFHPQFFFLPGGTASRLRLLAARRAVAVICHSDHSKRSYVAHGTPAGVVHIAPNPVDVDHFTPGDGSEERRRAGLDTDDFVVGNTSVMRAYKGQDVLLEAAGSLAPTMPDLRVVLAGGGPTEPDLRSLAERLGLSAVVRFVGYLADPLPAYRMMDVFVMSSTEEPFGLVTIEAMACGRAVVGTASGGTPEIVVDEVTGLLVPADSAADMAAAIRRLHDDRSLRARMGAAGRERACERYTARGRAAIVADVLRRVTGVRPSTGEG